MKSLNKTKNFAAATIFCTALFSTPSWADGHGAGNGGNAVVCFKNTIIPKALLALPVNERVIPNEALVAITSITALDLLEANSLTEDLDFTPVGSPIVSVMPNETNTAFIERIASRFERVPLIAQEIRKSASLFRGKISVFHQGLDQVYDVGHLPYSVNTSHCVLSTVLEQTGSGSTLKLAIDDRLFHHPKHSELSRKTLMLHEMVYRWAREENLSKESTGTRLLVGQLLRIQNMRSKILTLLRDYGFIRYGQSTGEKIYFERSFDHDLLGFVRNRIWEVKAQFKRKTGKEIHEFYRSQYYGDPNSLEEKSFISRLQYCQGRGAKPKICVQVEKEQEERGRRTWAIFQEEANELGRLKLAVANSSNQILADFNQFILPQLNRLAHQSCYENSEKLKSYEEALQLYLKRELIDGELLGNEVFEATKVPTCTEAALLPN